MFFIDIHSYSGYLLSARYVTVTILDTKGYISLLYFLFCDFPIIWSFFY